MSRERPAAPHYGREPAVRAPKLIAAFVCLLLAFALFQGWMWHWRPEPGWHPGWWQSRALATVGFFFSLPAMFPAAVVGDIGVTNVLAGWLAISFGVIVELALTYGLFYFLTRLLLRILRPDKPADESERFSSVCTHCSAGAGSLR
jgi:hypothetical protein